jgi:uncharacterized protein HemY
VRKILEKIGMPTEKFKTDLEVILAKAIIETVYDHNLTDEERELLGFDDNKEDYLKGLTEDGAFADLFRLYFHRGDWAKAKEYLKKIKDERYKHDIFLSMP